MIGELFRSLVEADPPEKRKIPIAGYVHGCQVSHKRAEPVLYRGERGYFDRESTVGHSDA
jgi:hypothetical protein